MPTANLACTTDFPAQFAELVNGIGPRGAMAAVLVGGVITLIAGGKLIKPLVVVSGLFVGGALGVRVIGPELLERGFDGPPELLGALSGAAGGLVLSLMLFRLIAAMAGGATLGGVALLGSLAYLGVTGAQLPNASQATDVIASAPLLSEEALAYQAAADEAFRALVENRDPPAAGRALASVDPEPARRTVEHVQTHATALWEGLPDRTRAVIGITTFFGAVGGVLLGLIGPRSASATVTAFAGGAATIIAGASLANSYGWMHHQLGDFSPAALMGTWLAVAGAGLWVQSTSASREQERQHETERAKQIAAAAAAAKAAGQARKA